MDSEAEMVRRRCRGGVFDGEDELGSVVSGALGERWW